MVLFSNVQSQIFKKLFLKKVKVFARNSIAKEINNGICWVFSFFLKVFEHL